jgi:hypothetical protein
MIFVLYPAPKFSIGEVFLVAQGKKKKIHLFSALHLSKSGEDDRPYRLLPSPNQESFQFHFHFLHGHPMVEKKLIRSLRKKKHSLFLFMQIA